MQGPSVNLTQKYKTLIQDVETAAKEYGRDSNAVRLVIVSKGQPVEAMSEIYASGQRSFAESYVQESLNKMDSLESSDIEWHFIGKVQTNKTRFIAERFDWVQSLDHFPIARRLNAQRPPHLNPLNVCICINIDAEPQKTGIKPGDIFHFAAKIQRLQYLKLRGLMVIPKPRESFDEQYAVFKRVRALFDELNAQNFQLDTLSMGMTQDFRAAIAAGATLLRIGTAVFQTSEQE